MAKGMNPQAMLKQAQKMQAKIQAVQDEASRETVEATAGGGMVTATVYGDLRIKSIEIDPEALDPEDVEMLQDMIVAEDIDYAHQPKRHAYNLPHQEDTP